MEPIDDNKVNWGSFDPDQLAALAGMSANFATARRLISTVYTAAEHDDGGDSLARLMLEIADSDPVAVAIAAATEAVQLARLVYGQHAGSVLALRAQRQMTLAEHNRDHFGERK
jgi:hypothetical protein